MANIIKDKDFVILKRENYMKACKVTVKRKMFIDKVKFFLDGIIGHPYGSTFEVKDGEMVKIDRAETEKATKSNEEKGSEKDNRNLQDSDSNQKLSREEIEQMKADGVSREHLIDQLIENSTTYQEKTEYSQEKWVKKKRNNNMRVDSLAQMMTHGNIRAGMTVMVVDSCDGLVAGAVLERLGGFGRVINFFPGEKPKRHFLEEMNFSKEIADTLLDFPLSLVNSLKQNTDSESAESQTGTAVALNQSAGESSEAQSDIQQPVAQSGNSLEEQPLNSSGVRPGYNPVSRMSKKEKRAYFKQRKKDRKTDAEKEAQEQVGRDTVEAKKILLEKNVDCLLIASKFHPTPLVMALSEYLAPSRQVVVFSQYMEALEDCYIHLRDGGDMINFRTTETWLREYQVLPNRTHPVINMTGTGGYLLVATKVIKPD